MYLNNKEINKSETMQYMFKKLIRNETRWGSFLFTNDGLTFIPPVPWYTLGTWILPHPPPDYSELIIKKSK